MCVCEQLNEELKQNLTETMTQKYKKSGHEQITRAVDKLQQEVGAAAEGPAGFIAVATRGVFIYLFIFLHHVTHMSMH